MKLYKIESQKVNRKTQYLKLKDPDYFVS